LESLEKNTCFRPYNNSWVRAKTPAEILALHTPVVQV